MKELHDISKCVFLRCLRDFEKWSKGEKIGKNEGKMAAPESANIHYLHVHAIIHVYQTNSNTNLIDFRTFGKITT